ncbi:MAG: phosphatase PAP2 family protein [Candidatus Krumholzibacteria bacterium]|jgi:hypothetical protein|nr:phosphatase PAP2 family protein [Candidatus Krumholzibacteria bacterium]
MWWIPILVVLLLVLVWPISGPRRRGRPLLRHTGPQWRRNYGRRAFLRLGLALGAAAVLVYSGADAALERRHAELADPREGRLAAARDALRAAGREHEALQLHPESLPADASDHAAATMKTWGERSWFLVWGAGALADWLWRSNPFSRWCRANFEAMCVGLPMLWTVQRVLGSNRPLGPAATPRWQPLAHANAASGHAFMAAIPWWTLADRLPWPRGRLAVRGLGLLSGWSRLHDRMHYPSQLLLGWVIAANAVAAVRADNGEPSAAAAPAAPASVD